MFQEWKIQIKIIKNTLDDIKCYFKDFITYFTYIGNFICDIIQFVIFPIYYVIECLSIFNKLGTYKLTDKFFNELLKESSQLEINSFDSLLDRGLPKSYKQNIKKWMDNNNDKIYNYNIPSTPEGELRIKGE
ncbi:MAG: hypothetical protein PHN69_08000 [Candidatus Pacebacteria bacterium]|nr:hypothetical protein [Candidatus Paceibacterota bacterium]